MSSILTNGAAIAALATLRSIDDQMETVQGRVSSGYRVGSAQDNAAYWSIATTMRSDKSAMQTVSDALGLSAATTDVTYNGLNAALQVVSTIKSKLTAAASSNVDRAKIGGEITELKKQLVSIAQAASFSGENWLSNTSTSAPGTKHMVGSFNRAADGTVSVEMIDFDAANSTLIDKEDASRGLLTNDSVVTSNGVTYTYHLLNITSTTSASGGEIDLTSTTTTAEVQGMLAAVEAMLGKLTESAATLGAVQSRIDQQDSFVKDLVGVIDKGISNLVDADMNEESTRLKALQTQQQLGIQALSIANTNAQNILQLFK